MHEMISVFQDTRRIPVSSSGALSCSTSSFPLLLQHLADSASSVPLSLRIDSGSKATKKPAQNALFEKRSKSFGIGTCRSSHPESYHIVLFGDSPRLLV